MRRSRIVVVLAALAVAALAATLGLRGPSERVATVRRDDFPILVRATGRLEAAVAYEVGPPSVQDKWEYELGWMAPEGSRVKEGDVVARFDSTEIEEKLGEHRGELEKAVQEREKEGRSLEISLKRLRLDLVKTEGDLKRVDLDLAVPAGVASTLDLEQARLRKRLAERKVGYLRRKIESERALVKSKLELLEVKRLLAEQKIAHAEQVLERFSVRAPVAGLVVYVPKRNGERWEVGESVWMMAKILKVADVSTLRVEAYVLEVDAASIAAGQPARVTVDAVPGLVLSSAVDSVGSIIHERSQQDPSKVVDAFLPLPGVDGDVLRPGMGVAVEIEARRLLASLLVPLEAVQRSAEGTYVEVRRPGGKLERRPVTLGERDQERVVVVAGLEEGEAVRLATAAGGS